MAVIRPKDLPTITTPAPGDKVLLDGITARSMTLDNLWASPKTLTNTIFDTLHVGNTFRIHGTSISDITGTGSAVLSNSPTLVSPNLGTPSAINLMNGTALPLAGLSGLAGGATAFLSSPTSANLRAFVADETGSGSLVFGTSPNITTPTGIVKADVGLGNVDNTSDATKWSSAKTLTFTTFDTAGAGNFFGIAGLPVSANTGTGAVVRAASPALTGVPTAPTASPGNNSTQIATTAYADAVGASGTYKAPGTGTLTRTVSSRLADMVHVADYGTDFTAISAAKADAIALGRSLAFTDGDYNLGTNTLELAYTGLKIIALGAKVNLRYSGSGRAVSFDGSLQPGGKTFDQVFGGPNSFNVFGGPNCTDLVYVYGVNHTDFRVVSRDGLCPFRAVLCVCNSYQITSTSNAGAFSTVPTQGCHFDRQYDCDYDFILEGIGGGTSSDYGCVFTNSGDNRLIGTVEGCPTGNLRLDSACYGFTLTGMDCEAGGTGTDFNIAGTRHTFINCISGLTNAGSGCAATYTSWINCEIAGLRIFAGATKNLIIGCDLPATPNATPFLDSEPTTIRLGNGSVSDTLAPVKSPIFNGTMIIDDVPGVSILFRRGTLTKFSMGISNSIIGDGLNDLIFYMSAFAGAALRINETTALATFAGGALSKHATAGIGYATGAGGTVTQATSRTTGVTLNKASGAITLFSVAGSATPTTFTVTNSAVAATDVVVVSQKSGTDKYVVLVTAVAAGSFQVTFYTTGGTTVEQPVFNFAVVKAVAA